MFTSVSTEQLTWRERIQDYRRKDRRHRSYIRSGELVRIGRRAGGIRKDGHSITRIQCFGWPGKLALMEIMALSHVVLSRQSKRA